MHAYAISDIHAPLYTTDFSTIITKRCSENKPDIMFLAGDYVDRGKIRFMPQITRILEKCMPTTMIGVFGNDDYEQIREDIKRISPNITWLEDKEMNIEINSVKIEILGTTGILDEPTRWQATHLPGIRERYKARLEQLEKFASKPKAPGTIRIYLTHYPPTYKTLVGEPRYAWPQMGSSKAEKLIRRYQTIDYVIHGHAHKSTVLEAEIGKTKVINTAFPARKDIVILELKTSKGLLEYF